MFKNVLNGITKFLQEVGNRKLLLFMNRLVKGELSLMPYESYDDYIRDTADSCISVRAITRSVCNIKFDGNDAARVERAVRNGKGFTTVQAFVDQISNNYDVYGNAAYYLRKDVSSDFLDMLWLPDVVFYVDKREVVGVGNREDPQQQPRMLILKQVFNFRRIHAFSSVGRSTVGQLSEYLRMKRYLSASWARNLQNDGVPSGFLKFKGKHTEEQKKQLIEDWERKYSWQSEGHRVGALDGDGEYVPIASKGLDYGADHKIIRDGVREGFRVPKVVLGDTDGVNFSNAFTSLLTFKLTEIDAFHDRLGQELTYFFRQNGYDVTITITSTLDLEDFRALAGVTGRMQASSVGNE